MHVAASVPGARVRLSPGARAPSGRMPTRPFPHLEILIRAQPPVMTSFAHQCRQGGPAKLPITWDRVAGGGRVSCPMCGQNQLAAALRNHKL